MKTESEIIELLSKGNLSDKEKAILDEEIGNNPELKKYKIIFDALSGIEANSHLDIDLLSEFILYKNSFSSENSEIVKLVPKIEQHIAKCEKCKTEFEILSDEYAEIDNFVDSKFENVIDSEAKPNSMKSIFKIFVNPFPRYSLAGVFGMFLFYFSLVGLSNLTTPHYKNLDSELIVNQISTTRGRTTPEFQKAMLSIENKDFSLAINSLEKDVESNSDQTSLFYTYYIKGLVHLSKSESTILGLFPSYNYEDVDNAIESFLNVIESNQSGIFNNINYNSYYYIGKAFLLKDDLENAKKYLNMVLTNQGSYTREAEKLLTSLE